jgi:gliding motility-associated-like protein
VGSVIYKSLNGKDFEFLTQVNGATTYTDKDVKSCITYYYRVYTVTEGKLGILQPTGSLTYQVTLPLSIDIKGILFSCATNPASAKEVEAVDEKKSFEKFYWVNSNKDTVGREQTFKLTMAGNYQLVGKTKDGCTATKSFTVIECCEVDFAVPTAFTPYSTAFNNTFLAKAENVTKFELRIFNRWGIEVFFTTNATQGWDGTFYGKPLQAGAYQVMIKYSGCKEGKTLYETSMSVLYLID